MFIDRKTHFVKMFILTNLVCKFNAIPIKIPASDLNRYFTKENMQMANKQKDTQNDLKEKEKA